MAFDALRFCRDHQIQYYTSGKNVRPGWIHIQCPIPTCGDHSNHGGFNPRGGYKCWKCGGHGIPWVVKALLHLPLSEAIKVVEGYDNGAPVLVGGDHKTKPTRTTPITLPGSPMGRPAIQYLRSRGFDPYQLEEKYGLLSTDHRGYWEGGYDVRWRIIIPIFDHHGRLVNFQGRDFTGQQEIRYKGCPVASSIVHHKDLLYGEEHCIGTDHVAVVEGVFDQWRLGDGFVATFGTSMTKAQLLRLSRYKRVSFLFDPEEQAQARAREAGVELAAMGVEVDILKADFGLNAKGEARDPGDLMEVEAEAVRNEIFFG